MKKNFIFGIATIIFATISLTTISSCAKKGCADLHAKNYDVDAKSDDGSCTYEGKAIIWQDQATSDLAVTSITTYKFYIGAAYLGSMATSKYSTDGTMPACGTTGFLTVTRDLGSNASETVTITVKDENDNALPSQTVTFNGGGCASVKL